MMPQCSCSYIYIYIIMMHRCMYATQTSYGKWCIHASWRQKRYEALLNSSRERALPAESRFRILKGIKDIFLYNSSLLNLIKYSELPFGWVQLCVGGRIPSIIHNSTPRHTLFPWWMYSGSSHWGILSLVQLYKQMSTKSPYSEYDILKSQ